MVIDVIALPECTYKAQIPAQKFTPVINGEPVPNYAKQFPGTNTNATATKITTCNPTVLHARAKIALLPMPSTVAVMN